MEFIASIVKAGGNLQERYMDMTVGQMHHIIAELKSMGYPIKEDTKMRFDLDLVNRKEMMILAFDDNGYHITVRREIENDNT